MKGWCGVLVLLSLATGCADEPAARPSFIVLSLDTVRADHLGLYGYDRNTSPKLDAIVGKGLVFDNAFTVSNNTLVAHASLFTGLQPTAHGADPQTPLADAYATLAEDLQEAGYQTAAFAAHGDWISARFGLDRGFEVFESEYRTAREVLREASAWLRRRDPTRPFFLFLHFYDAHSDWGQRAYDAPFDIRGRFTSDYEGPLQGRGGPPKKGSRHLRAVARGEVEATPEELRFIEGQYDEGLVQLDRDLGRFFETLFPMLDTWVFVTADHGEEFFEHGGMLHDQLFVETARIPLVVVPPLDKEDEFSVPRRSDALARIIDLRRTVLELAGVDEPEEDQGVSLLEAFRGGDSSARSVVSVGSKGGISVRTRDYSFFELDSEKGATGSVRLFDRRQDPAETVDLAGDVQFEAVVAQMRELLEEERKENEIIRARGRTPASVELDAEAQERLRSLGYGD